MEQASAFNLGLNNVEEGEENKSELSPVLIVDDCPFNIVAIQSLM